MSKNRNRSKLNKELISRDYTRKQLKMQYDYCLICCKRSGSFYWSCHPSDVQSKHRHGNGRFISNEKYRSYKSWKHNRKTQWK